MKKIIIIIALALTSLGSISSLYAEEILDENLDSSQNIMEDLDNVFDN